MSYVLAFALIVALHTAKRAVDAHRELAFEVLSLRLEHREHWQRLHRQRDAEEEIWARAIDVHRSARQAMHAAASRPARASMSATANHERPPRLVLRPTTWPARPNPWTDPPGPAVDGAFAKPGEPSS